SAHDQRLVAAPRARARQRSDRERRRRAALEYFAAIPESKVLVHGRVYGTGGGGSTEPRPPERRLRSERGVDQRRLAVELERRALARVVAAPLGQLVVTGRAAVRERDPRIAHATRQP